MTIGIDVSQLAYQNTGVSNYLYGLVRSLIEDKSHKYILFFSGLRRKVPNSINEMAKEENVTLKTSSLPPSVLDILWNRLHIIPIEYFVGKIDFFITSDWTEPPSRRAKKATILYDLVVYKYPDETDQKIRDVQKRKLSWVKKESEIVFCISDSTKFDAQSILGLAKEKLHVIYPGF